MLIVTLTLFLTITIGTICAQLAAPSSPCNADLDLKSLYDHNKDQTFKLFARQAQCQSTCSPVDSGLVNGTCNPTQCCTNSFAQSFFDCFVCLAQANAQTDYYYTKSQRNLDDLVVACAARGFLLNRLTFPGRNPDRTLSSFFLGPTQPGNTIHIQPTPEPPAFSILPITPPSGISTGIQSSSLTPSSMGTSATPRSVDTSSSPTSVAQTSGACRFTDARVDSLGLLIVMMLVVAL